jgi:hypothetical protein
MKRRRPLACLNQDRRLTHENPLSFAGLKTGSKGWRHSTLKLFSVYPWEL